MNRKLSFTFGQSALSLAQPPFRPAKKRRTETAAVPAEYKVKFETTKGDIVIQVHRPGRL